MRIKGWPNFRGNLGCSGSTLTGSIIRTLNDGEGVKFKSDAGCYCGYRFIKVKTDKNEKGYVATSFVDASNPPPPPPPPGTGGNVYGITHFLQQTHKQETLLELLLMS